MIHRHFGFRERFPTMITTPRPDLLFPPLGISQFTRPNSLSFDMGVIGPIVVSHANRLPRGVPFVALVQRF